VTKIDLEKFDRGVGRLHYLTEGGEEDVQKVDDYKYAGCSAMLRRVREVNPAVEIEGDERWLAPEQAKVDPADDVVEEAS